LSRRTKQPLWTKAVGNIHRCKGAHLVILPEIWNIGFMSFDRCVSEAEPGDGPTLTRLRTAAKHIGAHLHLGSFVEVQNGKH
jgi:predicted amidohydrolase